MTEPAERAAILARASPLVDVGGPVLYRGEYWDITEADLLFIGMLQDAVYCVELLWDDKNNTEYANCFRVWDCQWPLYRPPALQVIYATARGVGKSVAIQAHGFKHVFKRRGEDLLLSAPQRVNVTPIGKAVEDRIDSCRLTREMLQTTKGRTGFTHQPFGVDYLDGTKIVSRLPKLDGTGMRGPHVPDILVDEGQDFPDPAYTEADPTLRRDHVGPDGKPDYSYLVFGVHGATSGGKFRAMARAGGGFKLVRITAIQRPHWSAEEKASAKEQYGTTESPDYRRNILGEAGGASSPYFNTARLMAGVDQDPDSDFNTTEYVHQIFRQDELDEMQVDIGEVMDLPTGYRSVLGGCDVGLTNSPTEIILASMSMVDGLPHYKIFRRFELRQCTSPTIRKAFYAIARFYGMALQGFGVDSTGIGFPIRQEMEGDPDVPPRLLQVLRGYFFNSKVPVNVKREWAIEAADGSLQDQYGNAVEKTVDPVTGVVTLVTYMPMIEASTRILRQWIDGARHHFPMDEDLIRDFMGQTTGGVAGTAKKNGRKPSAFHCIDAVRALAMVSESEEIEAALATPRRQPVIDIAM